MWLNAPRQKYVLVAVTTDYYEADQYAIVGIDGFQSWADEHFVAPRELAMTVKHTWAAYQYAVDALDRYREVNEVRPQFPMHMKFYAPSSKSK